jgi:hypothetical protein
MLVQAVPMENVLAMSFAAKAFPQESVSVTYGLVACPDG